MGGVGAWGRGAGENRYPCRPGFTRDVGPPGRGRATPRAVGAGRRRLKVGAAAPGVGAAGGARRAGTHRASAGRATGGRAAGESRLNLGGWAGGAYNGRAGWGEWKGGWQREK